MGPFSGNSFFGDDTGQDDGAYEATASMVNGTGIYRFGVKNEFAGFTADDVPTVTYAFPVTTTSIAPDGTIVVSTQVFEQEVISISSGNLNFGGVGGMTHSWFIEGVSYFGTCVGSVNSDLGTVYGSGSAQDGVSNLFGLLVTDGDNSVSSGFSGTVQKGNSGALSFSETRFSGTGQAVVNTKGVDVVTGEDTDIMGPIRDFVIFGTKYSNQVTYGI